MSFIINPYTVAPAGDPYFSNVTSLLHMNGSHGGTSFPDVITANTWSLVSANTDTTIKKFGTASMLSTGNGIAQNNASSGGRFDFGTGDFTIEAWIMDTNTGTKGSFTGKQAGANYFQFSVLSGGTLEFSC